MGKIKLARMFKLAVLVMLAFSAFYSFIYYLASNSDAFEAFVVWTNQSHTFQSNFGEIKTIHLKFFGSYSEKTRGDTGYANFTATVNGSESSGDVKVFMKQTGGIWKVHSVKVNERTIETEE